MEQISLPQKENLNIEIDNQTEKRNTSILTIRVTPPLLESIDQSIEASEGKYATRAELVRNAIEYYTRHIIEGDSNSTTPDEQESTTEDLEHEANVEEALELIKEVENADFQTIEEFASKSKEKGLPKSVWSDDRIQKSMRKLLRDEVYPAGFWDDVRRFRKIRCREYVELLRKSLSIPRSTAKQLVENPDFHGEQYEEW